MKIAQVNVYFYPVMVGGIEWYVYNISRELAKRGHEVHVYATDTYRGKKILPADEVVEGIRVHRVPLWLNLSHRAKVWRGLYDLLIRGDFDVIHTYDYGQPHSYVAVKAGKAAKKPVVLTVFDVHSMISRPFSKRFLMKLFDKYFARFTLRNATMILARASKLVDPLLTMGTSKEKIGVTPSGISKEALHLADGSEFRKKYGVKGPLILYLGRLHPTKGLRYLIEAFPMILKDFPEAKIVMVGPDQVGYRNELVRLAENLKVENYVLFLPPIYNLNEKMTVYAACNVFVLPSGYEGFGQVLIEAMAQGKPVVATKVGGIPDLVKDGREGFLIRYGAASDIANSVVKLLSDERLAVEMGRRGRKRATFLTYDILCGQIEKIYEAIRGNYGRTVKSGNTIVLEC